MVITGVADRSYSRIGRLVYLDAANPENDDTNVNHEPLKCVTKPLQLSNEDAMRSLPQYHIVCKSTLPYRRQGSHGQSWR